MVPNFRSNGPIKLIFNSNLPFIIISHPGFIEIDQELFELIDIKTHRQTNRQTDTHIHIHADENNTCLKSKILGQVKIFFNQGL